MRYFLVSLLVLLTLSFVVSDEVSPSKRVKFFEPNEDIHTAKVMIYISLNKCLVEPTLDLLHQNQDLLRTDCEFRDDLLVRATDRNMLKVAYLCLEFGARYESEYLHTGLPIIFSSEDRIAVELVRLIIELQPITIAEIHAQGRLKFLKMAMNSPFGSMLNVLWSWKPLKEWSAIELADAVKHLVELDAFDKVAEIMALLHPICRNSVIRQLFRPVACLPNLKYLDLFIQYNSPLMILHPNARLDFLKESASRGYLHLTRALLKIDSVKAMIKSSGITPWLTAEEHGHLSLVDEYFSVFPELNTKEDEK